MNSLDANVILRYVLNDLSAQSQKASRVITLSQCYISDVILTEVVYVLEKLYGYGRSDIAVLLKRLISLQTVMCNDGLLNNSIDLYTRKLQLSFSDCYAAVEAALSGEALLSFDKDLIKHGGNHVREP